MIDHVAAFFRKEQEELRFRAYVTDAIKALTENTTHYIIPGIQDAISYGAYMPERWIDGVKAWKKEDTRTGDEVAEDVIRRAGLTLKGGNE